VVLSGRVAVVGYSASASAADQPTVRVHGARRFLGELDLFSSVPVVRTAVVIQAGEGAAPHRRAADDRIIRVAANWSRQRWPKIPGRADSSIESKIRRAAASFDVSAKGRRFVLGVMTCGCLMTTRQAVTVRCLDVWLSGRRTFG
jgi:hypothetical protein